MDLSKQFTNTLVQLRKAKTVLLKLFLFSALLFSFPVSAASSKKQEIVFAIVPQQSATRLAQIWLPFLQELGERSGLNIKFATAKDIPTFETCLLMGAYDVAYMNPYHYVVFHETSGYEAFAKQPNKQLRGVVVTHVDSEFESLDDLRGQKLAFPSPAAFGASVLPRAELRLKNISTENLYVKSHDSVYRAVALKLYSAGGGVIRTLNNIPGDLRKQLKIIHKTNGYTPHAFAHSKTLPASIIDSLKQAMYSFEEQKYLKPIGMVGFEPAQNRDWDDIRGLSLTQKVGLEQSVSEPKCHLN